MHCVNTQPYQLLRFELQMCSRKSVYRLRILGKRHVRLSSNEHDSIPPQVHTSSPV